MNKKYWRVFPLAATAAIVIASCLSAGHAKAQSDTTPPSVPTGISASLLQSSQIYVSWSPSTDNVGVIGYYLYRNGLFIASIPGYTFYTDSPSGGLYSYTVAAYDAAGNVSAQSSPSQYVTVVGDTTPPSAPTQLSASPSANNVALSWSPSTDNVAVVGYYVSRNGVRIPTQYPITGTSYTDTGLAAGVTYRYSVIAYDAAGNLSDADTIEASTIFDVTPPSVPQYVTASSSSPTSANLSWAPSTDNIEVSGYNIDRNGSLVTTVTASTTSYADSGLAPQTSYTYTVSAYDEVDNTSGQSIPVTVTTPAPDLTPPTVPQYLTPVAVSASEVYLTWQPSTDNVAVAGYYVYQDGSQIATTASSSYDVTGLTTSTTYEFAVRAYDTSNNVSAQDSAAATTLSYTPLPASSTPSTPSVPVVTSTPPIQTLPIVPPAAGSNGLTLATNLYFGARGTSVISLQTFLIQNSFLGPNYATGYFGSLTQAAVRQFQCTANVVCSGNAVSTGWGSVGPRTRAALAAY